MKKAVIRFEKKEAAATLTNEMLIRVFQDAFQCVIGESDFGKLSLASTNQKYGVILGADYLFLDLADDAFEMRASLTEKLNAILDETLLITHFLDIRRLLSRDMNRYAFYATPLGDQLLREDFFDNITAIMTRDTDIYGSPIAVTDFAIRKKGNLEKRIPLVYHMIDAVPHIHYDPESQTLYFIAVGNVPGFVLLAGLLYGCCEYDTGLTAGLRLTRLDYPDSHQKILHSSFHYDNVLGEYIQHRAP